MNALIVRCMALLEQSTRASRATPLRCRHLHRPNVAPVVHPLEADALHVSVRLLARLGDRGAGGGDGEDAAARGDERPVLLPTGAGVEGEHVGAEVRQAVDGEAGLVRAGVAT